MEQSRQDTRTTFDISQAQSSQPLLEQQAKDDRGTREPADVPVNTSKKKSARRSRHDNSSILAQGGSAQGREELVTPRHIDGMQVNLSLTQTTRDRPHIPTTDDFITDDHAYLLVMSDHHLTPDHDTMSDFFDQSEVSLQRWLNSEDEFWNPLILQRRGPRGNAAQRTMYAVDQAWL